MGQNDSGIRPNDTTQGVSNCTVPMDKIQKIRIPHTLTYQNIILISPSFTSQTIYLPHTASHKYTAPSPLPSLMVAWKITDMGLYHLHCSWVSNSLQTHFTYKALLRAGRNRKHNDHFRPARRLFFTASHSHSTTGRENSVILPKARKYYLCNSLQHQTYQESR